MTFSERDIIRIPQGLLYLGDVLGREEMSLDYDNNECRWVYAVRLTSKSQLNLKSDRRTIRRIIITTKKTKRAQEIAENIDRYLQLRRIKSNLSQLMNEIP